MQAKNETNVTFATELQRLLQQKGMTAADLARKIEISHVAIGNYLKGRIPHGDILVQIAKVLGVPADELIFGPEENRKGPFKELHLRDQELDMAKEDLAEIRRVDPEAFRTVRDVIATYRKRSLEQLNSAQEKSTVEGSVVDILGKAAKKVQKSSPSSGRRSIPAREPEAGADRGSG